MTELNTAQTIFFGLVVIGLIALVVWTALPDRNQSMQDTAKDCNKSDCTDKNCDGQ